jgi:hypothetical protein
VFAKSSKMAEVAIINSYEIATPAITRISTFQCCMCIKKSILCINPKGVMTSDSTNDLVTCDSRVMSVICVLMQTFMWN